MCTVFTSSLSLKIARLLLENSADPNAVNRFGKTPLFEAAQSGKVKSVELLFEFGARVGVIDNDGVHLLKVGTAYPEIGGIFARAESKRIREEREADIAAGLHRACDLCKETKTAKRCTGISSFTYNFKNCFSINNPTL